MKIALILLSLFFLLLISCGGTFPKFSCQQDSDCVSSIQTGCYHICNPKQDKNCYATELCPAIHKNKPSPHCETSQSCRPPLRYACERNTCQPYDFQKETDCNVASDCTRASQQSNCYEACDSRKQDCSALPLCPSVNLRTHAECKEKRPCLEPLQIACQESQCLATECNQDSDCTTITLSGCYTPCDPFTNPYCDQLPLYQAIPNANELICPESIGTCRQPNQIVCENHRCKAME